MTTLNLTLPDQLKATAEARAAAGGFASLDEYIASLIEADEALRDVEELRSDVRVGLDQLDAGQGQPWDPEAMKERVRQQLAARQERR